MASSLEFQSHTTPPQPGFPNMIFPPWAFPTWLVLRWLLQLGFPSFLFQPGFPNLAFLPWIFQPGSLILAFQHGCPKPGFPTWLSQTSFPVLALLIYLLPNFLSQPSVSNPETVFIPRKQYVLPWSLMMLIMSCNCFTSNFFCPIWQMFSPR